MKQKHLITHDPTIRTKSGTPKQRKIKVADRRKAKRAEVAETEDVPVKRTYTRRNGAKLSAKAKIRLSIEDEIRATLIDQIGSSLAMLPLGHLQRAAVELSAVGKLMAFNK